MAKSFKYELIDGPFRGWSEADSYRRGFQAGRKLSGHEEPNVKYVLTFDIKYKGYLPKEMDPDDNEFFVVREVALSKEQRDEIDRKENLKAAKDAEKKAKEMLAAAAKYREAAN